MKKLIKILAVITAVVSALAAFAAVIAFIDERIEEIKNHGKELKHKPYGVYERFIKRPLDCFLSTGALIVLSPVLAITSLLVKAKMGSPVLFKQERPGRYGKSFNMLKFRTMLSPQTRDGKVLTDAERLECIKNGIDILSDEERLPPLGRAMRTTSVDELPELINIIKGDMSIIGPRPLATIYLPYYTKKEMKRHDVRPGLTGLAQVNGRNTVSWTKKFEYDVDYANHITFINDLKILLKTVKVVLVHDDIGQGEERPEAFNTVRERELQEGTVALDDLVNNNCQEEKK